jgi:PAS domain S-box-containing protein
MNSKNSCFNGDVALRQRAEAMAMATDTSKNIELISTQETQRIIHELQVHQIELELQNEELRRAQMELDASHARYFELYDLAPIGYCTISENGIVMEANLTAATMLGVARVDLVGQLLSSFILAEDQDIYYRHRQQLFATNNQQGCRLRLLRPSNPPFWARLEATVVQESESGSPVCRVILSDIAESVQKEAALAESELRYRALADSGQALVWTAGLNKQCDYFNKPWLDFTGRTLEQELGDGWLQGVHPEDLERCLLTYTAAFDLREKFSMEYRLFNADGDYHWIQDDGTPRFDGQGKFLGYIGHCLDITARKEAEEKQENLQTQLFQSKKMESVGRLAGGVAHDFNNMLGIILGHVELAQEKLDPRDPLFTDLEHIRKAAEHSAVLTRQLLTFARKQIILPRVLDLNETMEGMLKMLQRLIGEDIDFVWAPGADLWPVKIDPSQLDQILANLCVNARDAIAGGGKLTVETKNVTFDSEYCAVHLDTIPGEYVLLSVSDDGSGMDQEILTKLFEPFFTTKETGKGTGLGLAMVYGIVKQNDGFINVSSEPMRGTTFNIYLPRHHDKEELFQPAVPVAPVRGGNETILLVEDELALLEMTTVMLQRKGYKVLAAATPLEAIELAEKHVGEIQLLLTDVIMPKMNGQDLTQRLLSLQPNLKGLFMSGYTADVIAHHGVLDKGVNFIQKPFLMKDLAIKVREVLEQEEAEH